MEASFWALELQPNKQYTQTPLLPFHISKAVLGDIHSPDERTLVYCQVQEQKKFIIASLRARTCEQVDLDLNFGTDEPLSFFVVGDNSVHLTGYVVNPQQDNSDSDADDLAYGLADTDSEMDDVATDDDESIDSDTLEVRGKGARIVELKDAAPAKAAAAAAAAADSSDSESDDGDYSQSESSDDDEAAESDDSDGDSDDDDDDDDSDGDGDDDEEESDADDDDDDDDEAESSDSASSSSSASSVGQKRTAAAAANNAKKVRVEPAAAAAAAASAAAAAASTPAAKQQSQQQAKTPQAKTPQAKTPQPAQQAKTPQPAQQQAAQQAKTPQAQPTAAGKAATTPAAAQSQTPMTKAEKKALKKQRQQEAAQPTLSKHLAGGLEVVDTVVGTGAMAKPGKRVGIIYRGLFTNGQQFDKNLSRQSPLEFRVGSNDVISGMSKGVVGMCVGGKRRLRIPPALAYGEAGAPPTIPRNATLLFEIELVNVR